ncbi:MAG: transporter substrate-binding domain-containing protein [Cytophagales bacterium]|nr:transporter substrate-binding domain-containing protein [Cytophagales bacterium]
MNSHRHFKLIISFLLILFAFFDIKAQRLNGDTWATARKTKRARLVLTNVYLVNFSETVNGQGSGICFDIMDDFATYVQSNYGVSISFDYQPVEDTRNFQAFLDAVQYGNGGVFGLGDITITNERKSIFEFAPPYFENVAILVTDRSVPELGSLSDIATTFKGMKAVSERGTTHDETLKDMQKKYGNFEIVYAESSMGKIDKVLDSPGYWSYLDFPNYLHLFSSRITIKRHSVGDRKGESFGFIMPKGSDWAPIITEFFNANEGYVNSEDYREVMRKNLGEKGVKLVGLLSRKK